MVDAGEAEIGVRQAPEPADDLVRADRAGHELVEKAVKRGFVHGFPCCHAGGLCSVGGAGRLAARPRGRAGRT